MNGFKLTRLMNGSQLIRLAKEWFTPCLRNEYFGFTNLWFVDRRLDLVSFVISHKRED
jgi:hypothetical protein